VHIGPHKTSSTFIQISIVKVAKELPSAGYYWPSLPDGTVLYHKSVSAMAISLKNDTVDDNLKNSVLDFIDEARRLNRNILLSSEEFDYDNILPVYTLRDILHGFNVTIVFVYREQLSQLKSLQFQLNRYDKVRTSNGTLPSTFYFKSMDDPPHFVQAHAILDRYAAVFRKKSIRVIDLAGVSAAQKNVAHVFVCEVVGVLCNRTELFQANDASTSNAAYNLVPSQVFTILNIVISAQGNGSCHFCGPQLDDYEHFAARLRLQNHTLPEPLPLATSRMSMLHPYARRLDTAFRRKYGSAMLYNNQTATHDNLANMKVEELNTETFLNDPVWKKWIMEEFQYVRDAKKLCGCPF